MTADAGPEGNGTSGFWASSADLPAVAAPAQLEEIELPTSLGDVVFSRLRDAIVDKSLPPGARIAEGVIARELGVSRTPVRETLWRLRQMGLIEVAGRKGYQVAHPSRQAIEHAYELREALEVFSTGVAAERATDEELAAIHDAGRASLAGAEAGDLDEFRRCDQEFHERATRSARNPRLKMLIEDTWALVTTLRTRDVLYDQASIDCGRAHVAIGDAMVRRDRGDVERLMRLHIHQVRDYVLRALEEREPAVIVASAN